MAIIRPSKQKETPAEKIRPFPRIIQRAPDEDEIPFVPAYDLYEAQMNQLSQEEAAMIALALYMLTPTPDGPRSNWHRASRVDAVSRRL